MKRLLASLAAILLAGNVASAEEKRLALLIGNSDYPSEVGRLQLPAQDIGHLKGALGQVGFQVDARTDLNEDGMEEALSAFEKRINAEAADGDDVVAFVYYSGHGASAVVQGTRKNYLLPAREMITSASELARRGVPLDDVIAGLSLTDAVSVFVVADACRNDLAAAFDRSGVKGFAPVPARPGMFIAHSTYPGQTAPDDGAFARTLAANITKPGLYSERAFALTNREVAASRGISQIPTTAGALNKDFCFNGCPGETAVAATTSRPPAPVIDPIAEKAAPQPAPRAQERYGNVDGRLRVRPGMWETRGEMNMSMMVNGVVSSMPPQVEVTSECTTPDDTYLEVDDLVEDSGCTIVDHYISGLNLTADLECYQDGVLMSGIFSVDLNSSGTSGSGSMELYGEQPGVGAVEAVLTFQTRRTGTCG